MYVTMIQQKDINIKKKFKYFLHKNLERICLSVIITLLWNNIKILVYKLW